MVKAWASGLARTVGPCVPDTAEVQGAADGIRCACVRDLSMAGAYLYCRTHSPKEHRSESRYGRKRNFSKRTVAHSTHGLAMGVMFRAVSPPFLIVLREWLAEARKPSAKPSVLV